MPPRALGPFTVSPIGLGCMNICHAYGVAPPPEQAEALLLAALDAGVTHFDTAALYGFGASESIVGQVLAPHRSRFTLASKCGLTHETGDGTVKPGRVMFEMSGVTEENAREAMRLAANKLPIKCKFVAREKVEEEVAE